MLLLSTDRIYLSVKVTVNYFYVDFIQENVNVNFLQEKQQKVLWHFKR